VKPGAFLDRDGVINIDRGYVFRAADFEFVPGVLDAARTLKQLGFALVVITNQSGIARGYYSEYEYAALTEWIARQFALHGAVLDGVYYCPHHPVEGSTPYVQTCRCRKPAPGLIFDAANEIGIDLGRSVLFGDKESDLEAGLAAGIAHRVLLGTDGRELPGATSDGLATARFRSLAEALQSPPLRALLARLSSVHASP
jgi:D-glycero-D-manno-heptose 1,7-bisphosphate phosphatase